MKLAQCLCPKRHCIIAATFSDDERDEATTGYLMVEVGKLIANRSINPWCSLCGAKNSEWNYEVGRMKAKNEHVALEELNWLALEQQYMKEKMMREGTAFDSFRRN